MTKNGSKIIIEGAPGAGKTTLLFGRVEDDVQDSRIPSFKDLGINIITEAITEIANEMRAEGKVPIDNIDEFTRRIIDKSISDSLTEYNQTTIIERGLPSYFFLVDIFKIKLPQKYYDFYKEVKYESPIFILETIESFDMSERNKSLRKGRVANLKQRKGIFKKTIKLYQDLGYQTEIVPLYSNNIAENNKKRIEHILKFIPKS